MLLNTISHTKTYSTKDKELTKQPLKKTRK